MKTPCEHIPEKPRGLVRQTEGPVIGPDKMIGCLQPVNLGGTA